MGHVLAPPNKPGRTPLGLNGLARIVAAARAPVLAIGGVSAARMPSMRRAGTAAVAVIGAIAEADDPERAAAALRAIVDEIDGIEEERMESDMGGAAAAQQMAIVANGKSIGLAPGTTLAGFLAGKGLAAGMAIVERNGEIVARGAYEETVLTQGDQLEVVHAVGGG